MGLDIRWPIGTLLLLMGALLAGYGLLADRAVYARSLGINVNLWWGVAMLVLGAAFVWGARRAGRGQGPPHP
jgi:hypothetical protein